MKSRFGPRRPFIATKGQALEEKNYFALKGLNQYLPDEVMNDKETPRAHDFRIFDPSSAGSRTAISKRLGHRHYSVPIGETADTTVTSTTGAADQDVAQTDWLAMKYTATGTGRLSKVELNLKNDDAATGPIIVEVYTDSSGAPGELIGTSSISSPVIGSSYDYEVARYIDAPDVTAASVYWFVAYLQGGGTGAYKWSSTTDSTLALTSSDSGNSWSAASFSLNFKAYIATSGGVKGQTRFYRSNAQPEQIFAHISNVYKINDSTGATTSIASGLTASATTYYFESVNDKLYFTNGVDAPRVYNGTSTSTVAGAAIATQVVLHKNRLFYLEPNTNRVYFSDIGAYETFGSTSFLYVPAPNTKDPVVGMISFQDNLLFFTKNTKYVLYGSDLASFTLRESTGKKGASSGRAICKDDSYVYFSDDDSVYRFNGGTDQNISEKVDPTMDSIATHSSKFLTVHDDKLRLYYTQSGESFGRHCLIYDLKYNDWLRDTNVYGAVANVWESQTDENELIVGNSRIGYLYYAEDGYSDVGRFIDFEYCTKYHSYDHPSRKHRIKRLYVFFRPGDYDYECDVQIDVDEQDSPTSNFVSLGTSGARWGDGSTWGGGAVWGGGVLEPTRLTIPGQNRKHQIRFVQYGVDNPVQILGYTVYTKMRRPI